MKKRDTKNLNEAIGAGALSASSGYFAFKAHKVLKRVPSARAKNNERMQGAINAIKNNPGTKESALAAKKLPYYKLGDDFISKTAKNVKSSRNTSAVIAGVAGAAVIGYLAKHISDNKSPGDKVKAKVEKGKKLAGKKGRYIFRFFGGRVVPIKVS